MIVMYITVKPSIKSCISKVNTTQVKEGKSLVQKRNIEDFQGLENERGKYVMYR